MSPVQLSCLYLVVVVLNEVKAMHYNPITNNIESVSREDDLLNLFPSPPREAESSLPTTNLPLTVIEKEFLELFEKKLIGRWNELDETSANYKDTWKEICLQLWKPAEKHDLTIQQKVCDIKASVSEDGRSGTYIYDYIALNGKKMKCKPDFLVCKCHFKGLRGIKTNVEKFLVAYAYQVEKYFVFPSSVDGHRYHKPTYTVLKNDLSINSVKSTNT